MSDVLETHIEFPVKVHFEFHKAEPMTRHCIGSDSSIEINAIEICDRLVFGNLYMEIKEKYEEIFKEEIKEKAEK